MDPLGTRPGPGVCWSGWCSFGFGRMSDRFLTADNLMQILFPGGSPMIVATGMTFVLLTAGVDLPSAP